jgi:amino acid transporter
MLQFFIEGGWGMYPVLVMGVILVVASLRYAMDTEPVRLRFIAAIALALVVTMVHATWTCFAAVFHYLEQAKDERWLRSLMTGLMESTRPATLGGALLAVSLILVAVGAYRSGQRELRALRSS